MPPIVIIIPASKGRVNGSGKWYYEDQDSLVYWKKDDGYYHLDDKYFAEDEEIRSVKKSDDYDDRTNGNGNGNGKENGNGNGNGKSKGKGKQ